MPHTNEAADSVWQTSFTDTLTWSLASLMEALLPVTVCWTNDGDVTALPSAAAVLATHDAVVALIFYD
jgi:hypothetical protein